MGKLKGLTPRVSGLKPRIGAISGDRRAFDQMRDQRPWRRWYKTARWQALRWRVLVRDLFTCQCGCGLIEADTSLLVADHKVPHRGDARLFWDEGNLQTLRKACHDGWKQRLEACG